MYTEYYGLDQEPFRLTPDPQFYFLGDVQNKALANLLYGINNKKGFIALTGEVGAGKTTLCRLLLKQLDDTCSVAIILNSLVDETTFLKQINRDLAIPYNTDSHDELIGHLYEYLIQEKRKGANVLVIVDEAQNLKFEVLEQIRMLSNLETEKDKLLQILLIGQPEFLEMLNSYKLRQLNQRITVRAHISALTLEDMEKYIYHRLKIAGNGNAVTFTRSALKKIYSYSGGIPRRVNVLSDYALLAGYVEGTRKIDRVIIKKALKDIEIKRTGSRTEEGQVKKSKKVLLTLAMFLLCISALVVLGKESKTFSLSAIKSFIEKGPLYSNVFSSLEKTPAVNNTPVAVESESEKLAQENTRTEEFEETIPAVVVEHKVIKEEVSNKQEDVVEKKELSQKIPEPDAMPLAPNIEDEGQVAEPVQQTEPEPVVEEVKDNLPEEKTAPAAEEQIPVISKEAVKETIVDNKEKQGEQDGSIFDDELAIPDHRAATRSEKYFYTLSSEEKGLWLLLSRWGVEISHDRKDSAGWRIPLENQLSRFGFAVYATWGDLAFLKKLNLPAALEIEKDGKKRYVTLIGVKDDYLRFLVAPGRYEVRKAEEFLPFWQGNALVLAETGEFNIGGGRPVFKGNEAENVLKIKNILTSLEFFKGEKDNIFGLELEEAVKKFQQNFGLPVDGIVGVETKLLLYSVKALNVPRIFLQEEKK